MRTNEFIEHIWQFGDEAGSSQVYALLDGARDSQIARMVYNSGMEHACLYAGRLSAALQTVAPYVVRLLPGARFTCELVEQGWGKSWGIFFVAPNAVPLEVQRRHFRTLLRVRDEAGRHLIFRFYDPRVLRIYLPTCNTDETNKMFGPNTYFLAENADATGLIKYQRSGQGVMAQASRLLESA